MVVEMGGEVDFTIGNISLTFSLSYIQKHWILGKWDTEPDPLGARGSKTILQAFFLWSFIGFLIGTLTVVDEIVVVVDGKIVEIVVVIGGSVVVMESMFLMMVHILEW